MNCRQRERKRGREALCTGRKCRSVPCHAAAQTTLEQMNPFHLLLWQLSHGAPGKEEEGGEGGRVAGGLRYEGRGEAKKKMIERKMEGGGKKSHAGWL